MSGATWVLAHGAVARDDLWSTWARDPLAVVALGAFALAYANGALAARRGGRLAAVTRRRAACAAGAVVVLAVALASPLDGAATALFSAHMVQHLLLTAVAAPLLALSAPVATIRRGLPTRRWPSVDRPLRRLAGQRPPAWWALAATLLGLGTLSVWHVPALYGAALDSALVHGLEHATLLLTAVVLWSAVLGTARRRQVLVAAGGLALSALHGAALGALLALSPRPWYEGHAAGAAAWGIDALADQQVAGAIMWVPTAAVHLGALAVLVHRWLQAGERRPLDAPTPPGRRAGAAASAAP